MRKHVTGRSKISRKRNFQKKTNRRQQKKIHQATGKRVTTTYIWRNITEGKSPTKRTKLPHALKRRRNATFPKHGKSGLKSCASRTSTPYTITIKTHTNILNISNYRSAKTQIWENYEITISNQKFLTDITTNIEKL